MPFKIDWVSLIVGSKFTVLLCIRGQFSKYNPWGAYILRGDLAEGFLRYRFGAIIFGGAYFRNFTVYPWRPLTGIEKALQNTNKKSKDYRKL